MSISGYYHSYTTFVVSQMTQLCYFQYQYFAVPLQP